MQFVVLVCIFIQVHLASDLLIAEPCQMAVLLWISARASGWLVQEMERARLGFCAGKSRQWGYRKKAALADSRSGSYIYL